MLPFEREGRQSGNCVRDTPFVSPNDGQCPDIRAPTRVAAIFASFGLNAPRNATVVVAFLVCALSIGGAVFLILEMDSPFQGVLRLSKQPMTNALAHMQL